MKKIVYIVILAAVVLLSACKKNPIQDSDSTVGGKYRTYSETYAHGEDNGVSRTGYNSVRDILVHFAYDEADLRCHIGDTILVEAYCSASCPERPCWEHSSLFLCDSNSVDCFYRIGLEGLSAGMRNRCWEILDREGEVRFKSKFILGKHDQPGCDLPFLTFADTTI